MARPLRIEYENAFYHVIQRGIERKNIFSSDSDKERFLNYLNTAHTTYAGIVHSYVLMDNHYHLVIETPRANLSKIMHYVNTSYAAYYNTTHKRVGPLYQGRFKAVPVQGDEYLHYLSCYIHLNPVRAGIVKSPGDYLFSSYAYFAIKNGHPKWLVTDLILSMFDKNREAARKLYACFVEDNIGREKDLISSKMKNGWILGDDTFVGTIQKLLEDRAQDQEIPLLTNMRPAAELSLDEIKGVVEKHIKDNARLCRTVSMYISRKYTQKTIKEIAAFYRNTHYASVSQACKRVGERKGKDRATEKILAVIEEEVEKLSSLKT